MLRTAVIGAGNRARGLMAQLAGDGRFALAAVVEPLEERRRAAQARFGIPFAAASLEALFAPPQAPSLDCAVIATPPWLHREAFCAVLARGLPCFCEKPMDMDLREADRMRQAAAGRRAPVLFGFNRRFTAAARLARTLRGSEPPHFVHTSKSRPMTYSRMLAENAVHAADLLLCLAASTPETVRATGVFKDAAMEAEGFISAAVSFVGGGGGSLQMVTEGHGSVERFEIYGRDYTLVADLPGSVRYGGDPSRLREAAASAGLALTEGGGGRWEVSGEPDVAAELGTFAALVRGETVPPDLPGPEEAFEAQRLVEAVYRSAGLPPSRWTGTWVREQ